MRGCQLASIGTKKHPADAGWNESEMDGHAGLAATECPHACDPTEQAQTSEAGRGQGDDPQLVLLTNRDGSTKPVHAAVAVEGVHIHEDLVLITQSGAGRAAVDLEVVPEGFPDRGLNRTHLGEVVRLVRVGLQLAIDPTQCVGIGDDRVDRVGLGLPVAQSWVGRVCEIDDLVGCRAVAYVTPM